MSPPIEESSIIKCWQCHKINFNYRIITLNLLFGSAVYVEGNYSKADKTENMIIIDINVDKNFISRVAASTKKIYVLCIIG